MGTVVKASTKEYTQILAYMRASQNLVDWISGARVFALLTGAEKSGVLEVLRTNSTLEQIASATNIDLQCIADLCLALEAHGVVKREGESYRLSPDFQLLTSPNAAIPLSKVICQADLVAQTLRMIAADKNAYTALPTGDVLAMAEAAGISSMSSSPHVAQETTRQMMPEVDALWQNGAHHLEVGCGVGNALFGILETYPQVTAVGIEINDQIAAEAKRRAQLLGIAERLELRQMDACDLQDENSYDTITWSQFFFPAASRPIVLKAMYSALKPGGYLLMPLLGSLSDRPSVRRREMLKMAFRSIRWGGASMVSFLNDVLRDSPKRQKTENRFTSLQRLLFNRWGVPVRSTEELMAEVTAGGFKVLRRLYTPVNQFVLTRRFLLVQREIV